MATHSSTLALRIPGTEDPGGLLFMGLQRVGHDWVAEHILGEVKRLCPGEKYVLWRASWMSHYFGFLFSLMENKYTKQLGYVAYNTDECQMSKKWVASNYTHPSVPCKHGSKPQMEVYVENSSSASVVSKAPFHMYCLVSSLEPRFEADIITPLWWKFCRNPFSFTMYFSSIIHINVIVLQYDKLKPQELNYWTKEGVLS